MKYLGTKFVALFMMFTICVGCSNIQSQKDKVAAFLSEYIKYSAYVFKIINNPKNFKAIDIGDMSMLNKEEREKINKYFSFFADRKAFNAVTMKMVWVGIAPKYSINEIKINGNKAIATLTAYIPEKESKSGHKYIFTYLIVKKGWNWRIKELIVQR